jgi:hypothetical protein
MQFELWQAGDQSLSTRRMTTLHLMLAIALCGYGLGFMIIFWFIYRPFAGFGLASFIGGLLIGTLAVMNKRWLTKGKRSLILRFVEIGLFASGAVFFAVAGQLIPAVVFSVVAALIGVAAAWETKSPGAQKIIIDAEGVILPKGMMQKLIRWDEIEGLIFRHSILTIELTENRLVQRSIGDAQIEAAELEAFSAEQIERHAEKRAANAAW